MAKWELLNNGNSLLVREELSVFLADDICRLISFLAKWRKNDSFFWDDGVNSVSSSNSRAPKFFLVMPIHGSSREYVLGCWLVTDVLFTALCKRDKTDPDSI